MSEQPELLTGDVPEDAIEYLDRHRDAPDAHRKRGLKQLVEMIDVVTAEYRRAGYDAAVAYKNAIMAVRIIAKYFGGRMAYLPKGEVLECALRDKSMWDRYHGRRDEVIAFCAEYDLTEQQVYKIFREQRALHVKRVQHSLPIDD